ncbi:hypothetical protein K438DRAFT_1959854 [Mycena galopus ATCC 62051]|nr:hypothetical protein K438DRAFT_1959854 [Mycena galopus ATCC 62051]
MFLATIDPQLQQLQALIVYITDSIKETPPPSKVTPDNSHDLSHWLSQMEHHLQQHQASSEFEQWHNKIYLTLGNIDYAYTGEALSPSHKEVTKKAIFIDQLHCNKFKDTPLHKACPTVNKELVQEYKKRNTTYQNKVITLRLKLHGLYKMMSPFVCPEFEH